MEKKYINIVFLIITFIVLSITSNVHAKEGWIKENSETYYYQNDQKLENFQIIDGKRYFFGIGSKRLLKGWQYYNGKFYADPETGEIKDGFQQIGKETYYAKDGIMLENFQIIDGKRYFFGIGSNRLLKGWQYYNGKFYADPETGEIKDGFQQIGKETYYAKDGIMLENFQMIDGKRYFFGIGSNRLLKGWQYYNGKFYADSETGEIKDGFQQIGKETYYAKDGIMLENFQMIDGKRYFFGIGSNRLLKGWQYYNGKFYADPETGEIKDGFQQIGKEIYYAKDGIMLENFQMIDGKRYFFGIGSCRLLKGWQYYNGSFYADPETGEIKDGFLYLEGKTYYVKDGHTVTGVQTIEGKTYFFSKTGHNEMRSGWVSDNGNMYYCNMETHEIVTGEQVIDGIKYDFGTDGKLKDGFVTDSNGNVKYYYSDGSYAVDWVTIAGTKYFFNGLGVMIAQDAKKVIDVSYHNKEIDWWTAKNSGGVDAAMIRLAYRGYGTGNLVTDTQFLNNINGASQQNIPIGVYVYSQAINKAEAIEEAERAINLVSENGGKSKFSLPIVIDTEYTDAWENGRRAGRADYLTKSERTEIVKAFVDKVKSAGYEPMIYASKSFLINNLDMNQLSDVKLWVAQYNHYCTYEGPGQKVMWQYSSTEQIPGISTNTDVSVMF